MLELFRFENLYQRNEAFRVTLAITICMVLGKVLALGSPVYLALYPTIIMTKSKNYSWQGIIHTFAPTLCAAAAALGISEAFHSHPFIIWTLSLFFFDWMRRRATTPAKMGAMLMPTFNWILIIVFDQHTEANMAVRIHEIFIAMLITACVCKFAVACFPTQDPNQKQPIQTPSMEVPVTAQQRAISLALIGIGVGFLMLVDMLSATFCMVPVIAASLQTNRLSFQRVVKRRFITQVGGCAIAAIFSVLLINHQSVLSAYILLLAGLVFLLASLMVKGGSDGRELHADALLATMLPIQLYMTSQDIGLERTFLRGWELAVTLGVLYILYKITLPKASGERQGEPLLRAGKWKILGKR
ncbi:DUF2955 domain-containing protein [Vibrio scophthalmi]|uniref:DUF2955 domain-containing protein n=1 Tax=Vibrio scophthalmi TaxID=45658 RepID=A0A1C7FGI0_9VIBR|nr:DUF2955 domain-containing protein [Vibrio scophthalmi]ANU39041.1 hypothetical protein VSVS05_04005 [Vibrio scophthalmi]